MSDDVLVVSSPSVIMALWWEKETRIGAWDIIKVKVVAMAQFHGSLSIPKRTGKWYDICFQYYGVLTLLQMSNFVEWHKSSSLSKSIFLYKYYDFSSNEVDYPSHAGMYRICKSSICSRSV
jgi:hypothetical protein